MRYSVLKINFILLSSLIVFVFSSYFIKDNLISFTLIIISIILILILLVVINYFFYKKFLNFLSKLNINSKNKWYIDVKEIFSNTYLFKENYNIEKEVKKYFLKSNLDKKDLKETKEIFAKFIPKETYDKIGDKWYDRITLWSMRVKNMTIIFLDIVWFTSLSEKIEHKKVLNLLNFYFDAIWEIVIKHKWYIDKYLWDWIMVLFEDWLEKNALECVVEIQDFLDKLKITDLNKKVNIWIWLNYWEISLWTIWTKKRMEATVIWDNVNIASRLQSITREFQKSIIFSHNFYEKIKDKTKLEIISIWEKKLKWKNKNIKIYWLKWYNI